jgi:hypothetical protein
VTLGQTTEAAPRPPGVRVVLDVRALQEPMRAPRTAAYLDGLLGAFDADPLPGESFAFLLASDEDDPTTRFTNLEVIGRRLLPAEPAAPLGRAHDRPVPAAGRVAGRRLASRRWRCRRRRSTTPPVAACRSQSRLPTVATLLDSAPWQLPDAFQRSAASRFGQRLRGQLLRDAAAVLVGTDGVADSARRLLHLRRDRVRVVRSRLRPLTPWVLAFSPVEGMRRAF